MAKLMSAGSLLVPLCALLFAFHAAWAETTDIGLPPEDLDSSGDDDDSFSGSGAGSLPAHPVVAWTTRLQESTNVSLMPAASTDSGYDQSEVQGTDSPTKAYERVHLSATSIPVFPTSDSVADKPAVALEEERGSPAEQPATRSAITTTVTPVTDRISTSTITAPQASSTVNVIEPRVHLEVHHDVFNVDKGVHVADSVPTSENGLDAISSTISSLSEADIAFPGDGSGDKDDPIYLETDENVEKSDATEAKSAGAPQGMMERKEVLGGVIAGGLVGLLFAGFLVGFMLYRMKKKDEGSYSLDEPKQSNGGYQKPHKQEEFYA